MKISELSKETNVSVRMIRYYEEKGLLLPTRTSSGYRRFTKEDIDLINKIKMFKEIGFTIDDIRPVLRCRLALGEKTQVCDKLKETFAFKIEQIDRMMVNLTQARQILSEHL